MSDIMMFSVFIGNAKVVRSSVAKSSLTELLPRQERGTSAIEFEWRASIDDSSERKLNGIAMKTPRTSWVVADN